jgi:lipoprotein-anchoring transpeptidase ErfK/SrfK
MWTCIGRSRFIVCQKGAFMHLSSLHSNVVTTAMSAGLAAVIVMAATPAGASPFDLQPRGWSQYQSAPAPAPQRIAYRSRDNNKEKEKAPKEAEDIASKAKGPMSVYVSIDKQALTLYSGDQPIAHSRVSTGVPGHPTPTGVFSVIQKDRWHRSNLYGNAPMWFMQRITWSGVAMHQGIVPGVPASHGCIRLPEAFARQLWGITGMGARVIVTRGEITPAAFSNAKLFVFKRAPEPQKPEPAEPADAVAKADDAVKSAYNTPETNAQRVSSKSGLRLTATDAVTSDPGLAAVTKPLKPGPISVFISRKEGKLFVRKGFEPVFDTPVTFERPDQPLGTHVYTALAFNADNSSLRWMVTTVPTSLDAPKAEKVRTAKGKKSEPVAATPTAAFSTPAEALERVTIPQEALDRIQDLMSPGASLIISDKGLGPETGKGTDFIVLTR